MAEPQRKRAKLSDKGKAPSSNNNKTSKPSSVGLYAPFRALGLVSTSTPFAVQSRNSKGALKPEFVYVTATGDNFAIWGEESCRLKFVGEKPCPGKIASIQIAGNLVCASAQNAVFLFERGRCVGILNHENGHEEVGQVLVLGNLVVGLHAAGEKLWVWSLDSRELYTTVHFPAGFTAKHMLHPATYLNKLLVASEEGSLAIWNIQTATHIHTFGPTDLSEDGDEDDDEADAAITALAQSPAVDVVAVGYRSGRITAFDIRQGDVLFTLHMALDPLADDEQEPEVKGIVSLSFRSDQVQHTLASASSDGKISTWALSSANSEDNDDDLGPRLLHTFQAHQSPHLSIQFLPGQPLLVSSSADNSLKQWLFDSEISQPRLLRERSGHRDPVHAIRHIGPDGKALLTASDSALRYTSIVRDTRSTELSTAGRPVKGVHKMSFCASRSRDWDDLVTLSKEEHVARSWSVFNKRIGKWTFDPKPTKAELAKKAKKTKISKYIADPGHPTAVSISACGNFAAVAFEATPEISMWNLQSGQKRKAFVLPDAGSVPTGLASDALNTQMIISTAEGQLHFFNFHDSSYITSVTLPGRAAITGLLLNRDNNLLAVASKDHNVRLLDIETKRVVRELSACKSDIVDFSFSNDGRWLIVASQDAVIRTFDLPTGRVLDAFRTPQPPNSLSFSPTGDFLATSHDGQQGVYLWANRAQFLEVSLRSFKNDDELPRIALPSVLGDDDEQDLSELDVAMDSLQTGPSNADQLEEGLISLSAMPRSKWQTLLNLDTIKLRNKPQEAPKQPERAPFFLPELPGTATQFDTSTSAKGKKKESSTQQRSHVGLQVDAIASDVVKSLEAEDPSSDYEAFFTKLTDLPPSTLDLELRSLPLTHLASFLNALAARLASGKDFEAVQALLSVFLRVQGDMLVSSGDDVRDSMQRLLQEQERETKRIGGKIGYCTGVLSFVRNTPLA